MDLVTKAPQHEDISQNSPSLQSFPGTGQRSFVFGDWGGLRSWLSNHGIDLDLSYLSEPAWNVAGGMAPGGTYAWRCAAGLLHNDVGRALLRVYTLGCRIPYRRKSMARCCGKRRLPAGCCRAKADYVGSRRSSRFCRKLSTP